MIRGWDPPEPLLLWQNTGKMKARRAEILMFRGNRGLAPMVKILVVVFGTWKEELQVGIKLGLRVFGVC